MWKAFAVGSGGLRYRASGSKACATSLVCPLKMPAEPDMVERIFIFVDGTNHSLGGDLTKIARYAPDFGVFEDIGHVVCAALEEIAQHMQIERLAEPSRRREQECVGPAVEDVRDERGLVDEDVAHPSQLAILRHASREGAVPGAEDIHGPDSAGAGGQRQGPEARFAPGERSLSGGGTQGDLAARALDVVRGLLSQFVVVATSVD